MFLHFKSAYKLLEIKKNCTKFWNLYDITEVILQQLVKGSVRETLFSIK